MSLLTTEMFAQFVYSPDLTYDDLHSREEALIAFTEQLLQSHDAEFINFEPIGDTLHAQCVFRSCEEELCYALCEAYAPLMDGLVEGRLLFVRKDLSAISLYGISQKKWQEAITQLPAAGPLGALLQGQVIRKKSK